MRKKFRQNEKTYIEYQSKAEKILENLSPIQQPPTDTIIGSWKVKSERKQSQRLELSNETKEEITIKIDEVETIAIEGATEEHEERRIEMSGSRASNENLNGMFFEEDIPRTLTPFLCRNRGRGLGRSQNGRKSKYEDSAAFATR